MRELDDDFYDFDEKSYSLTGRRYQKKYCLGDSIRIKVVRANLERKQLDFGLVE
jgi:ribonuclease R